MSASLASASCVHAYVSPTTGHGMCVTRLLAYHRYTGTISGGYCDQTFVHFETAWLFLAFSNEFKVVVSKFSTYQRRKEYNVVVNDNKQRMFMLIQTFMNMDKYMVFKYRSNRLSNILTKTGYIICTFMYK